MRVLDSEKAIALLEKAKKLLPGNDGILPQKYLSKDGMDAIIQGLREHTVDLDILANTIGLAGKKKDSDTLLTGFDHAHGDIAVLIIGRKESDGKVQIVNQFQGKEAEELYEKQEVLVQLNADTVFKELSALSGGQTFALICYERPSDFCHRHLVAEWFCKNGYRCEEIDI